MAFSGFGVSESNIRTKLASSDRFSLSSELAVSNLCSVFLPLMALSPPCLAGFSSFFRLLPSRPLSDSSADPPLASSADPRLNSSSDSASRSLPLLSYSLPRYLETSVPLEFGTSRCRNPSAPENCRNLSRPRGFVKMSVFCQSVGT